MQPGPCRAVVSRWAVERSRPSKSFENHPQACHQAFSLAENTVEVGWFCGLPTMACGHQTGHVSDAAPCL